VRWKLQSAPKLNCQNVNFWLNLRPENSTRLFPLVWWGIFWNVG